MIELFLTCRVQLFWVIFKFEFSLYVFFRQFYPLWYKRIYKCRILDGEKSSSIGHENLLQTALSFIVGAFLTSADGAPRYFQITMSIHIPSRFLKLFSDLNIQCWQFCSHVIKKATMFTQAQAMKKSHN